MYLWPVAGIMAILSKPVDAPLNDENPFGAPWEGYIELGYLGHPGVDYKCLYAPVVACDDGSVTWAGIAGTAGNMVTIQHSHGRTRYLHLSEIHVSVGAVVVRGQQIGVSGGVPGEYGAGLSDGAHLHLDYFRNGVSLNNGYGGRVDPTLYMDGDGEPITNSDLQEEDDMTDEQARVLAVMHVNTSERLTKLQAAAAELGFERLATELQTAISELTGEASKLKAWWG